jgi:hypothetical protein
MGAGWNSCAPQSRWRRLEPKELRQDWGGIGADFWKAEERRESGDKKREFEELVKRDWDEFKRRFGNR